jgi:4-hydroxybenzoate polyprenyltransferase
VADADACQAHVVKGAGFGPTPMNRTPLCVNLDGALVRNNLFLESILLAVKRRPMLLLILPVWLIGGRTAFRERVAREAEIDPALLLYRNDVLDVIRDARAEGRPVWLVTEGHQRYADAVSAYLGIFERAFGSDGKVNVRDKLEAENVSAHPAATPNDYVTGWSPKAWMRAIRIHQWAKNVLLFVPLVTAHALFDITAVAAALVAFCSMCLCASSTYIVNDLLDLESDRHHVRKRTRPFAAGVLPISSGLLAAAVLMISGGVFAWQLPTLFRIALVAYVLITLLYSFLLKRIASLDVITLAALYTLRVIAGAWAIGVSPSFWLLAFSTFFFLSLALAKRVAELLQLQDDISGERSAIEHVRGREYGVRDATMLQIMGASSGYLAVLVLALYINSPEVARLYRTQELLWLLAPALLLWITRLWVVTSRGYMNEDPIAFAIRDPETWATAAVTATILYVAATRDFGWAA